MEVEALVQHVLEDISPPGTHNQTVDETEGRGTQELNGTNGVCMCGGEGEGGGGRGKNTKAKSMVII